MPPKAQNSSISSNTINHDSSGPTEPSSSSIPAPITSKPKPIEAHISLQIMQSYIKSSNLAINLADVSIRPFQKNGSKHVRIQCLLAETKSKIIQILKNHAIDHFSYTENSNKSIVYILKGYDVDSKPEEILEDLKAHQISATKVTTIVKSSENRSAVHLVHFQKDTMNVNLLNHRHKTVFGARVSWEVQLRSKKKITQCHNCQRWGHSSLNCGYPARCVKCDDNHSTSHCSRIRSDEIPPKCVNCGGDHTANFSKCPQAVKYAQSIQPRLQSKPPLKKTFNTSSNVWTSLTRPSQYHIEFPDTLNQAVNNSVQPRINAAQLDHHPSASQPHQQTTIQLGQDLDNQDIVKENLVSLAPILSLPSSRLELLLKILLKLVDLVSGSSNPNTLIDLLSSAVNKTETFPSEMLNSNLNSNYES